MKNAVTALFLMALLPSWALAQFTPGDPDQYTVSFSAPLIDRVKVENSSGIVRIRPAETDRLTITYDKKKYPSGCTMKFEHGDPDEILAEVHGEGCQVDLDIRVPKRVDLDIKSASGSVDVEGLVGKLKFATESGAFRASGHFASVQGRSESGAIDISGVKGGKVDSESGAVRLKFMPDIVGQFTVSTESGNAELMFPKGSKLHTLLTSKAGNASSAFGESSRPDFTVNAESDSGNVNVGEY